MILYLLPVLDILTAVVLILHTNFGTFPFPVVFVHGVYLGFKGMVFATGDFASKVDILCAVYIVIVAFGLFSNSFISLAVFIWLMQKAILALIVMR